MDNDRDDSDLRLLHRQAFLAAITGFSSRPGISKEEIVDLSLDLADWVSTYYHYQEPEK